eukprot:TRINITY_DN2324_c0_g1_i13.p1 TRINITY_DN2324_c0_g1~~TRINITY_DN2324_c0_g1_i13.p1  ORF type:complete len:155 (+),score=29.19 TRINITY_DN2324_c0_g1_i13:46-465(+)
MLRSLVGSEMCIRDRSYASYEKLVNSLVVHSSLVQRRLHAQVHHSIKSFKCTIGTVLGTKADGRTMHYSSNSVGGVRQLLLPVRALLLVVLVGQVGGLKAVPGDKDATHSVDDGHEASGLDVGGMVRVEAQLVGRSGNE